MTPLFLRASRPDVVNSWKTVDHFNIDLDFTILGFMQGKKFKHIDIEENFCFKL